MSIKALLKLFEGAHEARDRFGLTVVSDSKVKKSL
jgi:hypothetical protein